MRYNYKGHSPLPKLEKYIFDNYRTITAFAQECNLSRISISQVLSGLRDGSKAMRNKIIKACKGEISEKDFIKVNFVKKAYVKKEKLDKFIKDKGYSHIEFGKLFGMSRSALGRLVRGENKAPMRFVKRIVEFSQGELRTEDLYP